MDNYIETFESWIKVASLYESIFMDINLYNHSYDLFCEKLPLDPVILEIGCGPGNITKYLINKRNDIDLLGIDIASNMIDLAQKNVPSAKFEVMDSRDINALDKMFDGIVCGFCIPYLSYDDCYQLIINTSELLNQGGLFYLSFVEGEKTQSGYITGSTGDRMFFYYHQLEMIKKYLLDNQFRDIQILYIDYQKKDGKTEKHTVLIAQKI